MLSSIGLHFYCLVALCLINVFSSPTQVVSAIASGQPQFGLLVESKPQQRLPSGVDTSVSAHENSGNAGLNGLDTKENDKPNESPNDQTNVIPSSGSNGSGDSAGGRLKNTINSEKNNHSGQAGITTKSDSLGESSRGFRGGGDDLGYNGQIVSNVDSTNIAGANGANDGRGGLVNKSCPERPGLKRFDEAYRPIHDYLTLGTCVFGSLTNIMNAVVLTRRAMRGPTNQLLTGIALVDSLTMLCYILQTLYFLVTNPSPTAYPHSALACNLVLVNTALMIGFHTVATVLTVMLAVFRCWILYSPLGCIGSTAAATVTGCSASSVGGGVRLQWSHVRSTMLAAAATGCLFGLPFLLLQEVDELGPEHLHVLVSNRTASPINITYNKSKSQTRVTAVAAVNVLAFSDAQQVTTSSGTDKATAHSLSPPDIIAFANTDSHKHTTTPLTNVSAGSARYYWIQLRSGLRWAERLHFAIYGCLVKILASLLITALTGFILAAMQAARRRRMRLRTTNKSPTVATIINATPISSRKGCSAAHSFRGSQTELPVVRKRNGGAGGCRAVARTRAVADQVRRSIVNTAARMAPGGSASVTAITTNTGGIATPATLCQVVKRDAQTRQSQRTTAMLITVVASFVVTEAPQGVLNTLVAVNDSCFLDTVYVPLGDFLDILVLLNSSLNFILYCAMSNQFREIFAHLFACQRPGPHNLSSTMDVGSGGGSRYAQRTTIADSAIIHKKARARWRVGNLKGAVKAWPSADISADKTDEGEIARSNWVVDNCPRQPTTENNTPDITDKSNVSQSRQSKCSVDESSDPPT